MPEKELSLQPAGEGELIKDSGKTFRVWFSFRNVEFERCFGYFKRNNVDPAYQNWPIYETRKYCDVSEASLNRLHKVVAALAMKYRANLDLFQMENGAGYELEI